MTRPEHLSHETQKLLCGKIRAQHLTHQASIFKKPDNGERDQRTCTIACLPSWWLMDRSGQDICLVRIKATVVVRAEI